MEYNENMKRETTQKLRKNFIMTLARIYIFFKVVNTKPKYRRPFICMVLVLIAVIAIPVSIYRNNLSKGSQSNQKINSVSAASDYTPTADTTDYVNQDTLDEWCGLVDIDFDTLLAANSDVIGWLYFENEDISYPILYSGDDDYYLHRNLLKEEDTSGSIFLEGMNTIDFNDRHSLIYGHNMKDLSMFGKLKYYKDDGYYENHQYFQILLKDSESGNIIKYRYHIFAYKDVSVSDDIYYALNKDYVGLATFTAESIQNNSYINIDEGVTDEDYVITLSTCSSSNDRFVISAKRCGQCVIEE